MFLKLTKTKKEEKEDFDILLNLDCYIIESASKRINEKNAKTVVFYKDNYDEITKNIVCVENPEDIVFILNKDYYNGNKFLNFTEIKTENTEQDTYLNLRMYNIKHIQDSVDLKNAKSKIIYQDKNDSLTYVRYCKEKPQTIAEKIEEIKNG
jgi:hypothetical protein